MIRHTFILVLVFVVLCRSEDDYLAKKCHCQLRHYDQKGCTAVYQSGSKCPIQYKCPENKPEDSSVCMFNGKTFKEGENIDVQNPCQICKCLRSEPGKDLEIKCNHRECTRNNIIHAYTDKSCYQGYEENKCCVKEICTPSEEAKKIVCEYNGETYKYGSRIFVGDVKECLCNEEWTGVNGTSCILRHNIWCEELDFNQQKWRSGCIPVYYGDGCCPSDMICEQNTKITTVSLAEKEDIEIGNTCVFNKVHYKIGQTIDHVDENNCITCTCKTPPDFTCVRDYCPYPTTNNCETVHTPGECCPTFENC